MYQPYYLLQIFPLRLGHRTSKYVVSCIMSNHLRAQCSCLVPKPWFYVHPGVCIDICTPSSTESAQNKPQNMYFYVRSVAAILSQDHHARAVLTISQPTGDIFTSPGGRNQGSGEVGCGERDAISYTTHCCSRVVASHVSSFQY